MRTPTYLKIKEIGIRERVFGLPPVVHDAENAKIILRSKILGFWKAWREAERMRVRVEEYWETLKLNGYSETKEERKVSGRRIRRVEGEREGPKVTQTVWEASIGANVRHGRHYVNLHCFVYILCASSNFFFFFF